MPTKKPAKKGSKRAGAARRLQAAMPQEAKAAYGEIKQGVRSLEKSIAEVQRSLQKAERTIEAEARTRIRELRKDAGAQLARLKATRRETTGALKKLTAAAGESWRDIKQSADSLLTEARATAASVVESVRHALGG